jgi:hypothetical protein
VMDMGGFGWGKGGGCFISFHFIPCHSLAHACNSKNDYDYAPHPYPHSPTHHTHPINPTNQVIGSTAGYLYRIDWMLTAPSPLAFRNAAPAATDAAADVDACGDVVFRRTPLAFVDSVWEVWGALLAGVP